MKFTVFLVLMFGVSIGCLGSEEVITLKSGRQISGIVVDETPQYIEVSTHDGATYKLEKNKIKGRGTTDRTPSATQFSTTTTGSRSIGSVRMGPQMGLSESDVSFSPSTSTSIRYGLVAGAHIEAKVGERFWLRPELVYNQGGYVVNLVGAETTFRYDVLKIPIYLKYEIPSSQSYYFSLFSGPAIGLRVKAESTTAGVATDLEPTTESVAWMWDLGGGMDYRVSPVAALFFNLRFSVGLNNLSKVAATTVKNFDLQGIGGVSFAL